MNANVGISVLLETYGVKERIKCLLVGWVRNDFVVLKAPLTPGIRSRITEGSHLAVRYLHEGNLIGFRAEYIDFIVRPYPLLFISYPHGFEVHSLRGKCRLECNFLATLVGKGGMHRGVILDISQGGCKFFFDADQGAVPKMVIGDEVEGYFNTLGSPQTHPFKGVVASVENLSRKREVGLRFDMSGTQLPDDLQGYMDEVSEILSRLKG